MNSHYVCWRGQVYRFDADTEKEARAKAFRWLDAQGYGGGFVPSPTVTHRTTHRIEALRGVA